MPLKVVAATGLERLAYYTDGFTLYHVLKVGPTGKLVDLENCFTGKVRTREVSELPKLQKVEPAKNVPLSRYLVDGAGYPSEDSG